MALDGINVDDFTEGENFPPNVYILLMVKGYRDEGLGDIDDFLERAITLAKLVKADRLCEAPPSISNMFVILAMQGYRDDGFGDYDNFLERATKLASLVSKVKAKREGRDGKAEDPV